LIDAKKAIAEAEKQVAFKIYKPTSPRGAIPNVRDAELPWVYDQDPSSGNVASMWVTPVHTHPQPKQDNTDLDAICQDLQEKTYTQAMRIAELEAQPKHEWVGLTPEDAIDIIWACRGAESIVRATEAKLKEKNCV
jgi:hypothetical protein